MASISRSRRRTDERSAGGKIVRGRRIAAAAAAAKTPYERPAPAVRARARAPPQNPNWLTGIIFPTSRMIATAATKLVSSVFVPDETSSSSSSSATDSSSSEEGMDDENEDCGIPFDRVGRPNKENGTTSELMECFGKEPHLTLGKSETKRVIEKLLMQETFSREECDRLIKIINSRVIDGSNMKEGQDGKLDNPDLCSKAVMEAKQWLEEKKVASSSKSDLDYGACTLSSVALLQVIEDELVSPVEIAKVFMRARPPWASPSITYVESGSPSSIRRELLKDETPYSVAGNSFSSSKQKIYSLSSGSWNIQEEIRRVHSKATEDMLKTIPSTKIDLPSFALEHKSIQKSLLADEKQLHWGGKVHDCNTLQASTSVDASVKSTAGASTCQVLPASVLELTHNSSRTENLPSQPVILSSAQNQDLDGMQTAEGEEPAASNPHHPAIPDVALEHDSRSIDRTCSSTKDATALTGNPNGNGFPRSGSSISAGEVERNPRHSDDKNPNPVGSCHDELANSGPMEETCELLSEASMEVPVTNDTTNNSISSSSIHCQELSQEELTQPNQEGVVKEGRKTNQQGRKPSSRYNRKSSRGKALS